MEILFGMVFELLFGGAGFLWRELTREEERPSPKPAPPPPVKAPEPVRHRVLLPDPLPAPQYVGPEFVARVGKTAHCQVCGNTLEKEVVACASCATLHHQECWTYARGCSTYGCRRPA